MHPREHPITAALLVSVLHLTACSERVHMTRAERDLIPLSGRRLMVPMRSSTGLLDTLYFERSEKGYETHIDVLWETEVVPRERGRLRGYYLSYHAGSTWLTEPRSHPTGALQAGFVVYFTKRAVDETLALWVGGFKEQYDLNAGTPDTLLFQEHERTPAASCGSCARRITWDPQEGVLPIESMDGTMWTRERSASGSIR